MTVCRLAGGSVDETIPVRELKPGQVAVIVACSCHIGLVVKRTAMDTLEALGGVACWTDCASFDDSFRVRVLPNGTLIRIEENE